MDSPRLLEAFRRQMVQINYPYVCVGAGQNGERNAAATVSAAANAFTIAWRRKKKKIVAAVVMLLADVRRRVASKVTAVARTLLRHARA
jgi:hypothetical protein